jgi:hypothetical protein
VKKDLIKQGGNKLVASLKTPLAKEANFTVRVRPLWFDANGTLLQNNTGYLTPFTNTDFPFFLFCDFDKKGCYNAGFKLFNTPNIDLNNQIGQPTAVFIAPSVYNWRYDGIFKIGESVCPNILFGLVANSLLTKGTTVFSYTSYGFNVAPNPGFLFLAIECPDRSYESICSNTSVKDYYVEHIDMFCNNADQNIQALHFVDVDEVGKLKTNQINPVLFKTVDYQQNVFIRMPVKMKLNQYKGIYSLLKYNTTQIEFIFNCKVKP